jgi:hypothetical protein
MNPAWAYRLALLLVGLSALDWMLTVFLMDHGAIEANILCARLFDSSVVAPLFFKMAVCGVGAYALAFLWGHLLARYALASMVVCYVLLVGYELWLVRLYG